MSRYTEQVELIISNSTIIFEAIEAIQNNCKQVPVLKTIITSVETLKSLAYPKIDLLVIDDNLPSDFSLFQVKNIINLTNNKVRDDELVLIKPFRLVELINFINKSRERQQLFCHIKGDWVYDEQLNLLFDSSTKIKFTEKENQIFKRLLLAPDHQLTRSQLLAEIWNYHPDIDSTTIEMHVYRLKNKLPISILHYRDNCCRLII